MASKKKTRKAKQTARYPVIILTLVIFLTFFFDNFVIKAVDKFQYETIFQIFYILTLMGEWYVFIWIAAFLGIILFINKKPVTPYIFALASSVLLNTLLKWIINRPRPFESLNIGSVIATSMSSFPSGHAMIIFCIVPVMSKNFQVLKWLFWTIAILVSLSRVYLGVHYLSDVVAGAVIGYTVGWASIKLGERYGWKY